MSAYDASEAVDFIREAAGNDIDIIFGVAINDKIGDSIIVSVIATGFDLPKSSAAKEAEQAAAEAQPAVETTSGVVAEKDDDVVFGAEEEETNVIPGFFRKN